MKIKDPRGVKIFGLPKEISGGQFLVMWRDFDGCHHAYSKNRSGVFFECLTKTVDPIVFRSWAALSGVDTAESVAKKLGIDIQCHGVKEWESGEYPPHENEVARAKLLVRRTPS